MGLFIFWWAVTSVDIFRKRLEKKKKKRISQRQTSVADLISEIPLYDQLTEKKKKDLIVMSFE